MNAAIYESLTSTEKNIFLHNFQYNVDHKKKTTVSFSSYQILSVHKTQQTYIQYTNINNVRQKNAIKRYFYKNYYIKRFDSCDF